MKTSSLAFFTRSFFALFVGLSLVAGTVPSLAYASEESLTAGNASIRTNTPTHLNIQIEGVGNDELQLNLFAPSGSFSFGTTTDIIFTGSDTGSSIQMTGTREALNAALATLTYESGTVGTVSAQAWLGVGDGDDFVYNSETQHVYQVVTATSTWAEAKALAEDSEFDGYPGYLVTITTQQEHDFVLDRISQDGWIGANDSSVEGEWRWMTGPEAGTQFWQGAVTGTTTNGMFANWATGEPNNDTSAGARPEGEDCAQIRFSGGAGGKWNDIDCNDPNPNYVVEFGAGEDHPSIVETDFNIDVTAPTAGDLAIEKIQEYANTDGGSTAPTVQDYEDAGIDGVTEDNLEEMNEKIANANPEDLSDAESIQDTVTAVIAYDIITDYSESGGITTAPTLQDYEDAGITGITEDSLDKVNESLAKGGTITDLSALQDLVNDIVEESEDSSTSSHHSSSKGSSGGSVASQVANLTAMGNTDAANALKAQWPQLFAPGTNVPSSTMTSATMQVRDLELGMTGDDVLALQKLLNANGFALATSGVGSPGNETNYFGTLTQAALAAYQAANGVMPTAGYFGPLTRASLTAKGIAGLWW